MHRTAAFTFGIWHLKFCISPFFRKTKLFAALLLLHFTAAAQADFYARDTIQVIEITLTQPDWDYRMDTAKYGAEGYLLAAQVKVNGVIYDSAGVKYKGNSSFDSTRVKNPLHIKLDYIHANANYLGYDDIKLSNGFSDPSSIREVLAYDILGNYMHAPKCNFARVFINGIYYGIYSSAESIEKNFLSTHFYSSENSFFKCNPANVISGQIPNLLYLGTDSANYYSRYEIESAVAWNDLIQLCDTLNNASAYIHKIMDVDRALWMLAYNNVTVNLDSYSGAFAQNYYLYRDGNRRFNPVIWDLNMCFGSFTNTGSGILSVSGMQQMSPMLHSTNGARPLIMKLLADTTYQKMYIAHMRTITSEFFANGAYQTLGQNLQTVVDSSVQAENYGLYTYAQFQQAMNTTIGNIPGITTLMGTRATYLASTSEFQQAPPAISTVTASPSAPASNDTIWITALVTNTTNAWLGYRDQVSKPFTRVAMYDDGLHHDGTAGDNIYGAYMTATSALMQYYIYAQNAAAGMFSPERAEHEFYSIQVAVQTASAGEVVINEFLADNVADAVDESGQHEDWIELYNRTPAPLSLFGLYLSDDINNLFKYAFPENTVIPGNGYLIVWADEDNSTGSYLHCNFKLSSGGEAILLSNAASVILDTIAFNQQYPDISTGRCPNGTGAFVTAPPTTFGTMNCPNSIEEQTAGGVLKVYPNPASSSAVVFCTAPGHDYAELINVNGQVISRLDFENENLRFDLSGAAEGLYLVRVFSTDGHLLGTSKIAVAR
ncbi:MAG: spore coat protein CotH [Bacteroidetes bacterium]|nr:MAG: spore coat protein CotH [Bacteroidota bacterium]